MWAIWIDTPDAHFYLTVQVQKQRQPLNVCFFQIIYKYYSHTLVTTG